MKAALRPLLRDCLARRAPRLFAVVHALRTHQTFVRQYAAFQSAIARKLYGDAAIRVLAGPFAGMRQVDFVTQGSSTPRWIGSYEQELHEAVERAIAKKPQTVVNVGCAEGYYAVGLARRLPNARVYSFDVDPWARRALRRLAEANRVDNVTVRGWCTHEHLQRLCAHGRALVVCDIEGGEYDLLDARRVPALSTANIVVELHLSGALDLDAGERTLRSRFEPTHLIKRIERSTRSVEEWRAIVKRRLSDAELVACIDEHRGNPPMWLVMWSRKCL